MPQAQVSDWHVYFLRALKMESCFTEIINIIDSIETCGHFMLVCKVGQARICPLFFCVNYAESATLTIDARSVSPMPTGQMYVVRHTFVTREADLHIGMADTIKAFP